MKQLRHRKPNRKKDIDYSTSGCYFVTICSQNKGQDDFGKIDGITIFLSAIGVITKQCWEEIPKHFPGIRLDEFVIMPDHIHGIVVIQREVGNANLRSLQNPFINRSKMLLSKVIQNFKAAVTREVNKSGSYQAIVWQKSFYDHIIHNYTELLKIREYIKDNPEKWSMNEKEFESIFKK